jgi:hypothetical protein
MPGLAEKVAELVEDAVQKGAKVISMPHLAVSISCEKCGYWLAALEGTTIEQADLSKAPS